MCCLLCTLLPIKIDVVVLLGGGGGPPCVMGALEPHKRLPSVVGATAHASVGRVLTDGLRAFAIH